MLAITIRSCNHPLLFSFFRFFYFICSGVLPECLCTMRMQCLQRPEEDIRSFGTGVTNSYGCWESNPDPVQEQQALLSAALSAARMTHCFRKGTSTVHGRFCSGCSTPAVQGRFCSGCSTPTACNVHIPQLCFWFVF